MKMSIKKKFTFIGAGMILGFIVMNILLTYLFMIPFSVKFSQRQLNRITIRIEEQNMQDEEEFQEYIDQLEEDMNTRITIVDSDGMILFTTWHKNRENIGNDTLSGKLFYSNKEELDEGKVVSTSSDREEGPGNQIRIVVLRRIGDDRYIFISRSYRSLRNTMHSAILFELVSGCVILIIGLIIVQHWSYFFVTPIEQLTKTTEHIANLEFDNKVAVKSEDELGQLANAINRMSDHLEANVEQLQNDIENRKKLVRNLSHEIKSPVAVIMGYADRMKAIISKNPDKAVGYCEIISDESARVDSLVKEMLEFSKLEQDYGEPLRDKFKAKVLFEDIEKRFRKENDIKNNIFEDNDPNIHIVFEKKYGDNDVLYADYVMMERAVYNLIRNAVTYVTGNPPLIRVTGEQKEDFYEISVFNSGSSIPEEDMPSIWEPFSKVDKVRGRSKKGYGLGLSIVREIVEKHNGYYNVNNVNDGIEFTISIRNMNDK